MQPSHVHYLPLAPLFFFFVALLFAAVVALLEIGVFRYTYEKIGIDRRHVFTLLLLSLLGSYINIPIAEIPTRQVHTTEDYSFYGVHYVVPVVHEAPHTILAVNVGGALVPTFLSLYLMFKNRLLIRGLVAVAIVALVVHQFAHPLKGVGIAVPTFIPPIVAALVAVILSPRSAAPLAYIAGSMGTLIGADLMNLNKLAELSASVASIGGAGTFDGVFLSGVLAVLLAW
jgi:uncharacterized membrane protein